ncbi:SDR family oxidoreductase [Saccharothrix texasensis]|uniref:Short-subunit dehydrogenase n=1 Tax=Saccharothrix texasensis TaxID=103734 RepID=A0A3N1HD50_9PSEU|nr:SDR family oxidoreductase [Saccharothrix texasensis]ROP40430.1 short-subunit dehydrogenase [Saccharothrix texasensis]
MVRVDDLRIRVVESGVAGAVPVVLLHGFPDTSDVWEGVAARLGERFRVVRFDVRGAGGSDAPRGSQGYRLERLVEDLVAVVEAVGGPVHLAGHDWGSLQGWAAVVARPELFLSFTSISGPDLGQVADWVRRNRLRPVKVLKVLARSWYIAGFKVPVAPELVWALRPVRKWLRAGRRELVNGLGLYRANVGRGLPAARVSVPVHQIELAEDPYVVREHLEAAEPWVDELTRSTIQAGHWAPRTHPEHVARHIADAVDGKRRKRLVVVTGAGSGIGRATALAFGRQGAEVVALDVDEVKAQETAERVGGHAYRVDVADSAAVRTVADEVVARHGVPDVVMANAGISVVGSFLRTSEEDWRRVVDVNLWGVVHTLRAFAPRMVDRGEGGHLVVTSSVVGYLPNAALPAYSTTKAAVLMLAQCLDAELRRHGIRVTALCPGAVRTNLTKTFTFAGASPAEQEERRRRADDAARRRGFGPEKVAAEVLKVVDGHRAVVPVTMEAKAAYLGHRIAPGLVRALGRLWRP